MSLWRDRDPTPILSRAAKKGEKPRAERPVTDPVLRHIGYLISRWEARAKGIELGLARHPAVGFTFGGEHLTARETARARKALSHALEMKRQLRDAYRDRRGELRREAYLGSIGQKGG